MAFESRQSQLVLEQGSSVTFRALTTWGVWCWEAPAGRDSQQPHASVVPDCPISYLVRPRRPGWSQVVRSVAPLGVSVLRHRRTCGGGQCGTSAVLPASALPAALAVAPAGGLGSPLGRPLPARHLPDKGAGARPSTAGSRRSSLTVVLLLAAQHVRLPSFSCCGSLPGVGSSPARWEPPLGPGPRKPALLLCGAGVVLEEVLAKRDLRRKLACSHL